MSPAAPEPVPIRGVLFDKDGTLIDFRTAWVPAYEAAARALAGESGDPAAAADLLRAGGYDPAAGAFTPGSVLACGGTDEIVAVWAGRLGRATDRALVRRVDRIFRRHTAREMTPTTDLAALFARLRGRGLRLGVATSDATESARAALRRFGVARLVDYVAGYDGGFGGKPGPGMVLGFCAALDLAPAEVAVVGDSRHDLEMARAAGAGLAVGVLGGVTPRSGFVGLADCVIDTVADIEAELAQRCAVRQSGGS